MRCHRPNVAARARRDGEQPPKDGRHLGAPAPAHRDLVLAAGRDARRGVDPGTRQGRARGGGGGSGGQAGGGGGGGGVGGSRQRQEGRQPASQGQEGRGGPCGRCAQARAADQQRAERALCRAGAATRVLRTRAARGRGGGGGGGRGRAALTEEGRGCSSGGGTGRSHHAALCAAPARGGPQEVRGGRRSAAEQGHGRAA